jgi:phosphatidylglycerophosphatase C
MLSDADQRLKTKPIHLKKRLVLFDFDGTITTHDTLAEIMIFYRGRWRYRYGLLVLSPLLALYVLKLIPNWKAKQLFISWFFKGEDITRFNAQCLAFSRKVLPSLIRPKALEMINHYKSTGATIAVVTASAENWVKPWCDEHRLICLATRLESKNKRLTGKFDGKNCHGEEKACRVKDQFTLTNFDEIIAYGDTSGDREMLSLAHQKHYKPFRD